MTGAASTAGGSVSGGDTVVCGETVTLTARPDTNYAVSGWSGGGCSGTDLTCRVTAGTRGGPPTTIDVTVGFRYVPPPTPTPQCTVTGVASPAAGGSVDGGKTVDCGETVSLSAVANAPGYRLTGWSGGGCSGTRTRRTSPDRELRESVLHGHGQRRDGGLGGWRGHGPVRHIDDDLGARVERLVLYRLERRSERAQLYDALPRSACTLSRYTPVTPATDLTYTASFERHQHTLTVSASPAGWGVVSGGGRTTRTRTP